MFIYIYLLYVYIIYIYIYIYICGESFVIERKEIGNFQ